MLDLQSMTTEKRNEQTINLDKMEPLQIAEIMNKEDEKVIQAVRDSLIPIGEAIKECTYALEKGGRIIYIGAGTSGRLGLLDAVECPPTFGVNDDLVIGLIAGGQSAFIKAVEGAEDSKVLGEEDLRRNNLNSNDIVIGIAASGRTPYVVYGLKYAKEVGCKTVCIVCNKDSEMKRFSDIAIELIVGPEVLTGSTRLKAGTAQKMVLNMISTGSMVGVGKVYKNLMVDLKATNEKLMARSEKIVIEATGANKEIVKKALVESRGNIKLAILIILLNCSYEEAEERLNNAKGHVRYALESKK